jgi:hypothetical protein
MYPVRHLRGQLPKESSITTHIGKNLTMLFFWDRFHKRHLTKYTNLWYPKKRKTSWYSRSKSALRQHFSLLCTLGSIVSQVPDVTEEKTQIVANREIPHHFEGYRVLSSLKGIQSTYVATLFMSLLANTSMQHPRLPSCVRLFSSGRRTSVYRSTIHWIVTTDPVIQDPETVIPSLRTVP